MQRAAFACVVASIVAIAQPAHADLNIQAAFTSGVSWRRSLPALKGENTLTMAREVPETSVPIGGSMTQVGASADFGVVVDDRWIIPALGMAVYSAVGSYDTIVTSADGSIARVRPWTTYEIDALLPGIGLRVKERRFMFSASLRTGLSYLHSSGSVSGGSGDMPMSLSNVSPILQAELEACRRLDPSTRLCLQVSPRIYDFQFMNGATFGLRVEWGR